MLDGASLVTVADEVINAAMQAETLYRFFAGAWTVIDRATGRTLHTAGA